MDTIGQKILKLRKEYGLSQENLGLELGVSRQTINKWEKEEGLPNTESVRLLCEFFKIDPNYLLNDDAVNDSSEIATAKIDKTDESALLQTSENRKKKRIRITCIVFACIFFLLFAIALFFTIWSGIALNTPNNGYDFVSTMEIKNSTFVWLIIIDLILIIIGVLTALVAKKLKM